ncbi:MAG: right-handed parallel beta-helix repeat-containing protein, partial [Candidatus Hodarchaeota archaeon]
MKRSKFFFLMIPIFLLFGLNCLDAGQQPLYTTENQFLNEIIPSRSPSQKITSPQSYIECEPIDITSDFQLNNSGFKGNGTIDDPILIEGYNITYSSGSLIYISGTTYYFRIANNLLNGMTTAEYGIDLHNVQNGVIVNNTIRDFFRYGIRFGDPAGCNNNVIANNTICNNGLHGIWTGDSHYNIIEGNTIYNNGGMGIILGDSEFNIIRSNIVYDCMWGLEICSNSNYN